MLPTSNLYVKNVSLAPFVATEAAATIAPGATLNLNAAGYSTLEDAMRACDGSTTLAQGIRDGQLQAHIAPAPEE